MAVLRRTLCLLGLIVFVIPFSFGVPDQDCVTIYNYGGVSAIHQSPECSHWIQSNQYSLNRSNCQFTSIRGKELQDFTMFPGGKKFHDHMMRMARRRPNYQHISCNLDMQIPLPGKYGTEEVTVGVVAVFDGFLGDKASKMASKLLLDYFWLHSVYTSFREKLQSNEEYDIVLEEPNKDARQEQHGVNFLSYNGSLPVISNESRHMGIFKDALLRSINDIDSALAKEALERNLIAVSGATVAVLVDGHLLVANVGNSKAILCSENLHSHTEVEGESIPYISAKELTKDHTPSRADERERLVAAGGTVFKIRDRYWANGIFPLTRAIGLVSSKSAGVISEPEVTYWQPLTATNAHLVVATNSIFKRVTPHDVCDLLHSAPRCSSFASSSDCIASTARGEGSKMDMSVVVVPLRSVGFS